MKKRLTDPTAAPMREFDKRAQEILAELQKELLPEHASEVIGINVDTGEYVLADNADGALRAFRKRWPGTMAFVIRVDGGPAVKYHGQCRYDAYRANRSDWQPADDRIDRHRRYGLRWRRLCSDAARGPIMGLN